MSHLSPIVGVVLILVGFGGVVASFLLGDRPEFRAAGAANIATGAAFLISSGA